MKDVSLISIICTTLAHIPSLNANCEAGGYSIHTVAKYKKPNPSKVFLINNDDGLYLNALDSEKKYTIEGEYKITNLKGSCNAITLKNSSDSIIEMNFLKYTIVAKDCKNTNLLKNLYMELNTVTNTIRVGKKLKISKKNKIVKHKALQNNATQIIKKMILNKKLASFDYGYEKPRNHHIIKKKDVINYGQYKFRHTQVGKGNKPFIMSIAELKVDKIGKYFISGEDKDILKKSSDFINRYVRFPVIFFTRAGTTDYIGDGADCSSSPVGRLDQAFVNWKHLNKDLSNKNQDKKIKTKYRKDSKGRFNIGLIEYFEISNAFDLNDDGIPDIIEINGEFAYLLKPNGEFIVINYGMGC